MGATDTRVVQLWAQGLGLALLCVGSFAAGLAGGFVLDDAYAIVHHPVVQGTAPLLDAFRLSFWGEALNAIPPSYRPARDAVVRD